MKVTNDLRIYNVFDKSGEIVSRVMADDFSQIEHAKYVRFIRNKICVAIFKLDDIAGFAEMLEVKGVPIDKIKIKLDEGAKMPSRAHDTDAGLDIFARESQIVLAKSSVTLDTGVHIEIPKGYAGFLKSKSGLNVKHGITSEGVIDCGYTGSICVKLYNNSFTDYKVEAGDKISQLVILPIAHDFTLELVETEAELYGGDTERGNGGFGSSGR